MMISRPYEANLGRKKPPRKIQIRENIFRRKFVPAGSRPDSCRSRELNCRLWRPGGGQMPPKGLREAPAPLGARQVDAKRRPGELRTGSCAFLRPVLGPQRRRKGTQIASKSGQKEIPKRPSFQITFRDRFLSM